MSVHISSADVTTSAQLLQNLEEEAASLFSDIRSRMSQVQTIWNSQAGSALLERFEAFAPSFDAYLDVLRQYAGYLTQTSAEYEGNEDLLTARMAE